MYKHEQEVSFNVVNKTVFYNYEIYNLDIQNNSNSTVVLDDLTDTGNIYVKDANGNQYIWFSHEYLEDDITINKGFKKEISLKINKQYNPLVDANEMVFEKIIFGNYEPMKLSIEL